MIAKYFQVQMFSHLKEEETYYPILTPLVAFISLCASFEASLIHSLETLTLTDIDDVNNMKSSVVKPHTKERLNHQPK